MTKLNIRGLALDSRLVKPGDLFMAVPGETVDGRAFMQDAIEKGAALILTEHNSTPSFLPSQTTASSSTIVPIIEISDLKPLIGFIASRFYAEPSRHLSVIGITGTNGKTSISHFIALLLSYGNKRCGIIGTLGTGFIGELKTLNYTTPDAITTHETLAAFKSLGASTVAMEVSSHALMQERVKGVEFRTAIFTNLSRDHLDYHGTMEKYWQAKKRLFNEYAPKVRILNLDNPEGRELFLDSVLLKDVYTLGYTLQAIPPVKEKTTGHFITTENLKFEESGFSASINTPWGRGTVSCPLMGRFNVSNVLAAIACACSEGMPLTDTLSACTTLAPVLGRMNCFGGKEGLPRVVIDYAHTPDALEQILLSLRPHCRGKLWCVFGCGGDRDRGKRAQMAAIAEKLSDQVILTMDNPRTEDPTQIMNDMLAGITEKENISIEYDRKLAIIQAITKANAIDLIVVAGKGHENYQILGTEKIPFQDSEMVQLAFNRRKV